MSGNNYQFIVIFKIINWILNSRIISRQKNVETNMKDSDNRFIVFSKINHNFYDYKIFVQLCNKDL